MKFIFYATLPLLLLTMCATNRFARSCSKYDDPFVIFLSFCGGLMQWVGVVAKANILEHRDQLVSLGSWNIAGSLSDL